MPIYKLPDFHLQCNIYTQNPRGTITGLRQAMVSCQFVSVARNNVQVLKVPSGTQIQVADTLAANFVGDAINIADKPSTYWEAIDYHRVAAGYPNEYDAYDMRFLSPPGPNPHA